MHYFCGVVVPVGTSYDQAHGLVSTAMAPHREWWDDDDSGGFWDYWVIGGRWTGALSEYDPYTDPANQEKCDLCHGTGYRDDDVATSCRATGAWASDYGCNGCESTGTRVPWTLQPFEGDVAPVTYALNARLPHTVLTPDGVFGSEWVVPDDERKRIVRDALEAHRDKWIVVVDYHS
jgi:hypothetical protein